MPEVEMAKAQPGWEERVERLCSPENFSIHLSPGLDLQVGLTNKEYLRLLPKLELIRTQAVKQAVAMLRGTIKYEHDDRTPEEWRAESRAEKIDRMNYDLLGEDAEEKLAGTKAPVVHTPQPVPSHDEPRSYEMPNTAGSNS